MLAFATAAVTEKKSYGFTLLGAHPCTRFSLASQLAFSRTRIYLGRTLRHSIDTSQEQQTLLCTVTSRLADVARARTLRRVARGPFISARSSSA